MGKLSITIVLLLFGFALSSCGGDEIDACIGAASDPITQDVDCDDCCKDNGYKRGIVSTTSSGSNSTSTCKCSGESDS